MISVEKVVELKEDTHRAASDFYAKSPEIGVIGAGAFAHKVMLPLLKKKGNLVGIATVNGINTVFADEKYHFNFATTVPHRLIEAKMVNTLFVLTRPNLHAQQTIQAFKSGKHVFVEKPIALSLGELEEICRVYNSLSTPKPLLMAGFNRRFAPATGVIKKYLDPGTPKTINIRVNAGTLPPDHWIHDSRIGGGRIVTEVCPFIDYAIYLSGSGVRSIHAVSSQNTDTGAEGMSISLIFKNGSSASIYYTSLEDFTLPGEEIEIICGEARLSIYDFRIVEINTNNRTKRIRYRRADLGYDAEVEAFLKAINDGAPSPIAFEEIVQTMIATFQVNTALRENRTISM